MFSLIWIALGSLIGGLAWVPLGVSCQLAVLWALVMVWLLTPSRKAAFTLFLSYYLVASRDAGQIIHRFIGMNDFAALCIVIAYSAAIALMWALAWQRRPLWRFGGLVFVLLATSIPPLGGFIYGSPLLAAGWLYPGTGFMGIGLLLVSWGSVFAFAVLPKSNTKSITTAAAGCLVVASVVSNVQYKKTDSNMVYAMNTNFPLLLNLTQN